MDTSSLRASLPRWTKRKHDQITGSLHMKTRHIGTIGVVAFATLLAGCASGRSGREPFSEATRETEVKLFVTNLAFNQVTLYGITNGNRRHLGRLTGKKETVFTLPMDIASELYLEIDFLAGPKCFTERMIVDPGDHLDLVIQNENLSWRCSGG